MSYSLEDLEEKFTKHAKSFKESLDKIKQQREENGWEKPSFDEDFCLPDAFLAMIKEIQKLKKASYKNLDLMGR